MRRLTDGFSQKCTFMCLLATYFWVHNSIAENGVIKHAGSVDEPRVELSSKHPLPLDELRLFIRVFEHIRRAYVDPISDQDLLENAIKGMLQELDPHSDYLDASHFSALREATQGEFAGVGLEIGTEDGRIKVVTPIDGAPAQRAGLQAGDIILKLNQQSIRGLSLGAAVKKIRGPVGTDIVFTIARKGQSKPIDIVVTRGIIKARSVRSEMIEKNFGYIRIAQFQNHTGKDFSLAVKALLLEHADMKGLVIDLRNNPGGVLQASIEVADAVLDEGLIVYTEGRLDNNNQAYSAAAGDITRGLPIVVLINGGSASAAEIVAGALQDQGRGIIMGTRSFGKGSVQTVLPIDATTGIKLTTARYFTPKGHSIQAQGIEPDILIKPAKITQLDTEKQRVKEAHLSKHLKNQKDHKNSASYDANAGVISDNQLFEALNMLKGLALYQQARMVIH